MKFSLINVEKEENGIIEGVWLQDHTGTLKTAIENAIATEKANNDRLDIAVVEALGFTEPNYSLQKGLKRLDRYRNRPI